ncbi:hypothetical protein SAMN02927930_00007 [Pseudidiomarina indica]|uniref:Uncharacterized protein n=1 Tax=Pseudidiomarina indica TaxID=1159017 RepID=A0A1G6A021_9GAMM|nr:hypothetical protein [Pseudidiomarina indica]SDB01670.1 hypothetical protein SAMN02927930_00007 [Pseudidiomarina indica]
MEKKVWQAGLDVLMETTPILGPAIVAMTRASRQLEVASDSNNIVTLNDEANRQRVELSMAEMQAKVAQEVAIARRIEEADEVEIEEYYEGEAQGNAGLETDGSSVLFGVSGKGSRVTKRVYRFKRYPS